MKNTVWILSLEPIDTRYTRQWHDHLPEKMREWFDGDIKVRQIDGEQVPAKPSPGAFLDFAATNIWKSTQLAKLMHKIQDQEVKKGDYVLVTDAWNPAVLQIRYTSDLLGLELKLGGIWHAGSYDPNDFLGRACGGVEWTQHTEQALYAAFDDNYFATDEHIELMKKTYELTDPVRTGFPFEYFQETFEPYQHLEKRDLILFPHRIAPEKRLDIFKSLAERMPEYEWVVCQEQELTKDEYHTLLGESRLVFSANLQETLGISMMEGIMCNSFPVMPERLSYPEMYDDDFLYPSWWASSESENLDKLEAHIKVLMSCWKEKPSELLLTIAEQRKRLEKNYLTASIMYDKIKSNIKGV